MQETQRGRGKSVTTGETTAAAALTATSREPRASVHSMSLGSWNEDEDFSLSLSELLFQPTDLPVSLEERQVTVAVRKERDVPFTAGLLPVS